MAAAAHHHGEKVKYVSINQLQNQRQTLQDSPNHTTSFRARLIKGGSYSKKGFGLVPSHAYLSKLRIPA